MTTFGKLVSGTVVSIEGSVVPEGVNTIGCGNGLGSGRAVHPAATVIGVMTIGCLNCLNLGM